ncbi:DUF1273 family protein [bacterium 1xD42-67]|nr:DUF1273 family protein [bacterium 1xD42-67]
MREQTCCFTGHRKISSAEQAEIIDKLKNVIDDLCQRGIRYYGAGGAIGFDTLAAKAVLAMKEKYPGIKLILVFPCLDQTRRWNQRDIEVYERIKSCADKIVYTSQKYTTGCMHKRNRHLVDNSSVCVCYMNKASGGTAYTVRYAQEQGLKIINIA